MKLEDKNFEEEFIKWLNSKSETELVESLSKYKSEEDRMKRESKIEIIENTKVFEFQREVGRFVNNKYHKIKDIKFAVTPKIHGGNFSSYSSGETYYAMIIYEKVY